MLGLISWVIAVGTSLLVGSCWFTSFSSIVCAYCQFLEATSFNSSSQFFYQPAATSRLDYRVWTDALIFDLHFKQRQLIEMNQQMPRTHLMFATFCRFFCPLYHPFQPVNFLKSSCHHLSMVRHEIGHVTISIAMRYQCNSLSFVLIIGGLATFLIYQQWW